LANLLLRYYSQPLCLKCKYGASIDASTSPAISDGGGMNTVSTEKIFGTYRSQAKIPSPRPFGSITLAVTIFSKQRLNFAGDSPVTQFRLEYS
jgi:hypothetical protein